MAIAITSTKKTVFGNKKIAFITGTFANGDTAGDVVTGFVAIDFVITQYVDVAKIINSEISATGGTVSLNTEDPLATKTWTMMVVGH